MATLPPINTFSNNQINDETYISLNTSLSSTSLSSSLALGGRILDVQVVLNAKVTKVTNALLSIPKGLIYNFAGYLEPKDLPSFSLSFKYSFSSYYEWVKTSGYYNLDYDLTHSKPSLTCSDSYMEKFSKIREKITSIEWSNSSFNWSKLGRNILSRMFKLEYPNLTKISISNSNMTSQEIEELVSNCPNLQFVDIPGLANKEILILKLKKLRHIVFGDKDGLTEKMVEALNQSSSLETVNLLFKPIVSWGYYREYVDLCNKINVFKRKSVSNSLYKNLITPGFDYGEYFNNLKGLNGIQAIRLERIDSKFQSLINGLQFLEEVIFIGYLRNGFPNGSYEIPDDDLKKLIKHPSVTSLSFENQCKFSVRSFTILSTSTTLKKLKISNEHSLDQITPIFNSTTLETLEVSLNTSSFNCSLEEKEGPYESLRQLNRIDQVQSSNFTTSTSTNRGSETFPNTFSERLLRRIRNCKSLKMLKITGEVRVLKEFQEQAFQIRSDLVIILNQIRTSV